MANVIVHGSRLKGIRAKCVDCAGSVYEATKCEFTDCALWPYHTGHRPEEKAEKTPQQAIKAYCYWCCAVEENRGAGAWYDALSCIYDCPCETCGVWPYRPRRSGQSGDPEE